MKCLSLATVLCLAIFATPALAATPPSPSASFEAGTVHVDQFGDGTPALVLIPGLTDGASVWNDLIARYAPKRRIYALTLPGFGARAPIRSPMLETVAHDIGAFLPKADKPVLIGHSLGGFLAIRLAEEHSELLRGVVAIDGLPVFPGMDKYTADQRAEFASQYSAPIATATPQQFLQGERAAMAYMTKPENLNAVVALSGGADPAATARYMNEMMGADLRPQLGNVKVPLLEVVPFDATLDPVRPFGAIKTTAEKDAYYKSLLAGDPTAKTAVVNDSRHFVMFDQPNALYGIVDDFLKGI
ncbi:MAG: alpha/beta hydrolase [Candidatus Meridianibacter frigidus]|nr:MAG: alpha/beta hydrolase [Candidatus Eremiobacteraeota bacterium]